MKFFVRFAKDPEKYSIIDKQNLPVALSFCKQYREDCLLSRMDDKSISPNNFLKLKAGYKLEDIAVKSVYELQYSDKGEKKSILVECCEFELERVAQKTFNEPHGKLFTINETKLISKRIRNENVPVCIIFKRDKKQNAPQLQ